MSFENHEDYPGKDAVRQEKDPFKDLPRVYVVERGDFLHKKEIVAVFSERSIMERRLTEIEFTQESKEPAEVWSRRPGEPFVYVQEYILNVDFLSL